MKKTIKILLTAFAVCSTLALAAIVGGCAYTDDYEQKINQLTCTHEWNDGEVTKTATCTEMGELEKVCTLCDYVKTVTLPALGHQLEVLALVQSTCLQEGLSSGIKCSVCDTVLVAQETLPLAEHTVVIDKGYAATCAEDGLTDSQYCLICAEVFVEATVIPGGHVVAPFDIPGTCTSIGWTGGSHCDRCGEVYEDPDITPITHNYDGVTCTVCGAYDAKNVSTKAMSAVAFDSSEKIAGGFYRIYYNVTAEYHCWYGVGVSSMDGWRLHGDDYYGVYLCYTDYCGSDEQMHIPLADVYDELGPIVTVCASGYVLDDVGTIETMFMDIYIAPAVNIVVGDLAIWIDGETKFENIQCGIKRLVFITADFTDEELGDNGVYFPSEDNSGWEDNVIEDNLIFN